MALANLFTVSSLGAFFLFPLYIKDHGGSEADIGIVMGTLIFASVLCRPWISEMVDLIGRKRSYTIGSIIMSILPLAYLYFKGSLSDFYLPLLVVRFFHGVGMAICFTAVFTYIADIIPEGRLNEGIGMFGVSGLTGLALGPVIGELIIRESGFSFFFIATSVMATLGLLLHLPLPESYTNSSLVASRSFFSVLLKRKTLIVSILAFLFGIGLAASSSFLSPYAKEQHISFISLYYITYSSAALLTRFLGGRLADRVGEERIIPYALALTGIGLIALILLGGNFILILAGFMSGCGHGFLFPCLNSLAVRNEPIDIRGKITGAFTGGLDGGVFVGSIVLGYIGEWSGFRMIFLVAGLALMMGLGVVRFHSYQTKDQYSI